MKTESRRDLEHCYLVLTPEENDYEPDYQMNMIMGNRIPGLIPLTREFLNGVTSYRYDVTSLQPLTVYCEAERITGSRFVQLIQNLIIVISESEEYLLDPSNLILRPEQIYVNWESLRVFLAFLPGYAGSVKEGLRSVVEYFLTKLPHDDQQTFVLAYRLYHELQKTDVQMSTLKRILAGLEDSTHSSEEHVDEKEEEGNRDMQAAAGSDHRSKREKTALLNLLPEKRVLILTVFLALITGMLAAGLYFRAYILMWFTPGQLVGAAIAIAVLGFVCVRLKGRRNRVLLSDMEPEAVFQVPEETDFREVTEVPGGDGSLTVRKQDEGGDLEGATVLLTEYYASKTEEAYLEPEKADGELRRINLTHGTLLVGKHGPVVDVVLPSQTVSRVHAKLSYHADHYYVSDLCSRNGTKVDGHMLNGNEEVPLEEGVRISFADCVYIFHLAG